MGKLALVIYGAFEDSDGTIDPNHEFGEYDTMREARRIWAAHDGIDGPVKIMTIDGVDVWPRDEA